ncbi:LysE family translocator [Sutcliffiella horikoshii]|uniref:LysE family translocator n=1 Tax=Sutcliffiella horikoshii TaxID=79883 RepID=A0A5D4SZN5_9BACI|nr:LysE family translocator [Sutcliffiella horikoshii]TYS67484.1 LysE family translocator [Sutcliffiella horikoshii]
MENFFLFVLMSILLIILPGPDTAIATKNTLSAGRMGGFKTVSGTFCAILIHTIAAVVGLSAIIVKSAFLFSVFKYVGAVYLVYLGVKTIWALRHKKTEIPMDSNVANKFKNQSHFKQGFLTNMLNPKVAVFFLTFLPQFVDPGTNTIGPFLLMGVTYAILTAIWFALYIYLVDQISAFMKRPRTTTVIESITGIVLIGFGVKLALEKGSQY